MKENDTNRLEKKLDNLLEDVAFVKATLTEREKTEVLRNEVVMQAMKTQEASINNINTRVCNLEDGKNKIIWLVISTILLALLGTVVGVSGLK